MVLINADVREYRIFERCDELSKLDDIRIVFSLNIMLIVKSNFDIETNQRSRESSKIPEACSNRWAILRKFTANWSGCFRHLGLNRLRRTWRASISCFWQRNLLPKRRWPEITMRVSEIHLGAVSRSDLQMSSRSVTTQGFSCFLPNSNCFGLFICGNLSRNGLTLIRQHYRLSWARCDSGSSKSTFTHNISCLFLVSPSRQEPDHANIQTSRLDCFFASTEIHFRRYSKSVFA